MRVLLALFLTSLPACGTPPHALDDLAAVHEDSAESFRHRFQVERFPAFGALMRFGFVGQILGPLRYEKRSKEEIPDPANFCAERMRVLRDSGAGAHLYSLESVLWAGRALLSDSYSLSRLFAAEALQSLGREFADSVSWEKVFEAAEPGYADRVKLLASELATLAALHREGKANAEDGRKLRQDLAELAAQRYAKPSEDLAILRLFLGIAAGADSEERRACEEAGRHLVSRTVPRLLLAGLRDPNEFVREGSLVALHRLYGSRSFAPALRALAAETSAIVRRRLARLCGEMSLQQAADPGQGGALDFLLQASRDAEGSLAAAAMESLSRIAGIAPRWDREFWKAWGEEYLLRGVPPSIKS